MLALDTVCVVSHNRLGSAAVSMTSLKPSLAWPLQLGCAVHRYFMPAWESSVALPAFVRIRHLIKTSWKSSLFLLKFSFLFTP